MSGNQFYAEEDKVLNKYSRYVHLPFAFFRPAVGH